MKKIFTFIALAASALWASAFTVGNFSYTVTSETEKTVTLSGKTEAPTGALVIPSQVTNDGITYTVTAVGTQVFNGCKEVTSLSLPPTLKRIEGEFAFAQLALIEELVLPENLEYIGVGAFQDCISLKSITFNKNLKEINEQGFLNCAKLEKVDLPANLKMGKYIFRNCQALREINIPDSYEVLPYGFLQACKSLKSIKLPSVLKQIPGYLLAECDSLLAIEIPARVDSIQLYAFNKCVQLESVTFKGKVKYIGSNGFAYDKAISKVTVKDINSWLGIKMSGYMSNPAYYAKGLTINDKVLTDLVIPEGTDSIYDNNFYGNTALKTVTFPTGVKYSGASAFNGCTAIESVYAPSIQAWCAINFKSNSNPAAGHQLYINNVKAEEIVIPADVKTIGSYAFYKVPLTAVTFSEGLDSIGDYAFSYNKFTSVKLPNSLRAMGRYVFQNSTAIESVEFGSNLETIGAYAFYTCTALKEIKWNENISAIGNYSFYKCTSLKGEFSIPDHIVALGDFALGSCFGITKLIIGKKVKRVGVSCFSNCTAIDTLVMNSEVCGVYNNGAFTSCKAMTTVIAKDLEIYAGTMFMNSAASPMSFSKGLIVNGEKVTEVVLTGRAPQIGQYAFYNCKDIKSVNTGDKVETVFNYAFYGCSGLTDIVLGSKVALLQPSAFTSCSAITKIECRNPEPPACKSEFMSPVYSNATVYVPSDAIDKYKETPIWSKFTKYVALQSGNIDESIDADSDEIVAIYNIQGQRIDRYIKGLNICRTTSGKVIKVMK